MKNIAIWITGIIAFILILGAIIYLNRWFSNATTPITLHQVKPGITCATMVTSDGAAIDCWKD
jgi:hypothetical protein